MNQFRLFVYGTMMRGQRDSAILEEARFIDVVQTEPRYTLVDVDRYAALLVRGRTAVQGELYLIDEASLALVDRANQVPHLFQRDRVVLADGTQAEAHFMNMEQVRGKRRLGHGSWLRRFAPRSVPHRDLAFAQWARQRSTNTTAENFSVGQVSCDRAIWPKIWTQPPLHDSSSIFVDSVPT